jgi:hypothetical protein
MPWAVAASTALAGRRPDGDDLGVSSSPDPTTAVSREGGDARVAVALLYTAVMLAVTEYWFIPSSAPRTGLPQRLPLPPDLAAGLVWIASTLLFYTLIPVLVVRLWHRAPLRSVGYGTAGLLRHLPVYLALYAVMAPLVWLASLRTDFASLYPFVPSARSSLWVLLVWELAYAAQFVALESFFRGYLLFTCETRMGLLAIPVMVVPYTMIHFHKPFLECLGAVVAGLVLGHLALRFRVFWGGALLHILVAVSMDLLAVHRAGLF